MKWILIILLFFQSRFLIANPPIFLEDNKNIYNVSPSLEILEDFTNQFTIEEISKLPLSASFTDNKSVSPNFGFTKSVFWTRFRIENLRSIKEDVILEIEFPLIDQIELFEYSNNKWQVRKVGIIYPFHFREMKHRNFLFPITIPANSKNLFYIRFKSEDTLQIPMSIWNRNYFFKKDYQEQCILGLYYGILIVMTLFNLILYISIRDNSYLMYVLYITTFGIFTASQYGLAYEYIWPNFNWGARLMNPFLAGVLEFTALNFTRSFLQTKRYTPRLDSAMKVLGVFAIITSILSFTFSFYFSVIAVTAIAFFVLTTMIIGGFLTLVNGYKPAKYFLLAFLSIIVSAALYVFKTFGLIPNNIFTNYGLQIGSAIEMILLSLGIGNKINVLRKERTEALQKQLEESEKIIALGKTFEKYVPMEFLKILNKANISEIQIGEQVQNKITILFANIRNYSLLNSKFNAEENFKFINFYLSIMAPIIHKNKGFIDKYIGEGIMALFDSRADNAVFCAIEMQLAIQKINEERKKNGLEKIILDIGINTGEIILGTIGGISRISTTVFGDAVNTASRVSSLNKIFEKSLLISEYTYQSIEDKNLFKIHLIQNVSVKGKAFKLNIYEVETNE